MEELTLEERKRLRLARFGGQNGKKGGSILPGMANVSTTVEAMQLMEEQKRKKLERAERFGIPIKELQEKRIKERQERFGIQTKESVQAKLQERKKRFGAMLGGTSDGLAGDQAAGGEANEELEAKRKARMERFGAEEVEESQKSALKYLNRRKQKMLNKKGAKRTIVVGDGETRRDKYNRKRKFEGDGNSNQKKRFKKGNN